MIPELGHYALVLALALALVQSSLPMIGAARGDLAWMATGGYAALAQLVCVLVAFAALTWAYVVSDFSVLNVVENSHSAKPMLYKVAGVWGNHEGSMVLWVLILALFGAAVTAFGSNLPPTLRARVLAVQGLIAVGFLLFILATSNPFIRVDPPPADGMDLNPLLQDPGLAFHPPMLYLGYVGFSMAFSFAVAALIEGRVDPAWARWVRPWTLAAWVSLTAGISLGSWWAYYELGWGGWWYWDPVENASFMPWLLGTALLHSAIVAEKRDALKSWTILLAILTFALSLMGTFLVRSGVLTSVHAFAVDPDRGLFILALLVIATGGSLLLYAFRAPALKAGGLFQPVSREGMLVVNNLLLSTACATVFIGTLYPLFLDAVGGGRVSVGPPFFNATFVPLMVPMVVLMVVAPLVPWKRGDLAGAFSRLKLAFVGAALAVALALWAQGGIRPVMGVLGCAIGAWAVVGAVVELAERVKLFRLPLGESLSRARHLPRAAWGMALAHAGIGVMVFGMVGTDLWMSERIANMRPGETIQVGGYDLRFDRQETVQGPNFRADEGRFTLLRDGAVVAALDPEQRWYPVARMSTTEAAIHTTLARDVYVVMGDRQGDAWTVRVYVHPLVPFLWLGAAMLVLGGLVSLADRRLRVGAPERRKAGGPLPQPAE
jgi:cytochrome c-type biogenesis protein CcmF